MKKIWGHAGNHRVNFLSVCTPRLFDMKIRVLTVLQDPHSNLILLGKGIEGGKCCFPDHILLSTSLFCCCSFPLLLANGWCLVITPSPRNGCLLRGLNQAVPKGSIDLITDGEVPLLCHSLWLICKAHTDSHQWSWPWGILCQWHVSWFYRYL